ncbi:MAG: MBL fold metallo-hydrolase [Pseudomonadota bacterium]|nr:MBL fold metallo-hydrolase [Pseudomonadota bacterium]
MIRRILQSLIALAVVLGIGAAIALRIPVVQDRLVIEGGRRYFAQRAAHDPLFADDALRVIVCGSSAPMPDPGRAKPCIAVIAGGRFYLFDIGPEATETLARRLFPLQRVGAVFITHLHSDHIGELGEFAMQSWANGRERTLDVYGPPGIERVVAGFNEVYALDNDYRTAHHGGNFLPREAAAMLAHAIEMPGADDGSNTRTTPAYTDGDFKVTAIEINHRPVRPAYAYRIDYKGRSVVISGDTAPHPPLAVAARDADVLFHESNSTHILELLQQSGKGVPGMERFNQINHDVNDYHSTPVVAAGIANPAGG